MNHRRRRRHGLTLVELLVSFALISITLAVVSGSFFVAHRGMEAVRARDGDVVGVRRLARLFRLDVARASAVRIDADGTQCELQTADGHTIRYGSDRQTLQRTVEDDRPMARDRFFARSCTWRFRRDRSGDLIALSVTPEGGPSFEVVAAWIHKTPNEEFPE